MHAPYTNYACSLEGPLLSSYGELANLEDFDLGFNSLNGTIPDSWPSGMRSLSRIALDSNAQLCGPLPEEWTSDSSTLEVMLTFFTRLGQQCATESASQFQNRPPADQTIAVLSTTIVWPGGDVAELQSNGGLAEQRFRLQYRRGLSNAAGSELGNVAIISITQGSIIVKTEVSHQHLLDQHWSTVDFLASKRSSLVAFVTRIRQNTFDVSQLFNSEPGILEQYGPTPFVSELSLTYMNTESLSTASLCPKRPPAALYAPARVPFLPSRASDDQGFHVVLVLEAPFDLSNDCTDA
eukprot:scaffold176198_cov19-Tisochrysis_lutea.AAC.2